MNGSIRVTRSSSKTETSVPRTAIKRGADLMSKTEVPTTSSKKRQRDQKRRRSSFIAGRSRRSLVTSNPSVSELYKKVDPDALPDKRLHTLKNVCFDYAMGKLQEEFPQLHEMGNFLEEAQIRIPSTLKEMSEEQIFYHICSQDNVKRNPVNDEIEASIVQLERVIERLKAENEKWEELLKTHTDEAEKTDSTSSSSDVQSAIPFPSTLSVHQRKLLDDIPDPGAICLWVEERRKTTLLQLDKFQHCSQQLQKNSQLIKSELEREIKSLAASSFEGMTSSPRKLIAGILKH